MHKQTPCLNTFDNFEFLEDGDDEAGDGRPDVPEEVHVRGGETPQLQRPTRGRRSRSKPIPQLPEPNELAEYGWEDESQPWGWREARKYVPIRFLLRFWPAHEHQTMVNQQKVNGPKYNEKFHWQLLRRFGQLFPALKSPLGNLFPQYVVQMVYAEKILGHEIRWEDLPPRSRVGAHGGI